MPDNEINGESAEMNESRQAPGSQDSLDEEQNAASPPGDEQISEPSMKDLDSVPQDGGDDVSAKITEEEAAMLAQIEDGGKTADAADSAGQINRVSSVEYEQFHKAAQIANPHNIDMLMDVTMPISIELGRTSMPIQDILNLGPGSVVELNKLAGEPVDLLVNEKLIAKGEVVVVDENFGIRITSMISQEERIKSLG